MLGVFEIAHDDAHASEYTLMMSTSLGCDDLFILFGLFLRKIN